MRGAILGATAVPTEAQTRLLAKFAGELEEVIAELNETVSRISDLYRDLATKGLYPATPRVRLAVEPFGAGRQQRDGSSSIRFRARLLPESRVWDFLSVQFELSVVGSLWKRWADANDLYDLDPAYLVEYLATQFGVQLVASPTFEPASPAR